MSRRRLIPVALAVLAAVGLTSASCHTEVHRVRYDPAPRALAVRQPMPPGEQAMAKPHQTIAVTIGADVPPAIAKRAVELLQQVNGEPVARLTQDGDEARTNGSRPLPADTLVISLGDSALTRSLIPQDELHHVGSEGFILRSRSLPNGSTLIAAETCGRSARLLEYDPVYCDTVIKRWETYAGKRALLDGDGGSFEDVADVRLNKAPARPQRTGKQSVS